MEPLRQRGPTYQQPPRGMARQVKEAPQPRASQHLRPKIQANTEANQIQISTGGAQRPKSKNYRNMGNRLTTLKHRFLQVELTTQDYADHATFLLHIKIRQ